MIFFQDVLYDQDIMIPSLRFSPRYRPFLICVNIMRLLHTSAHECEEADNYF